jgi:hypothetical protein
MFRFLHKNLEEEELNKIKEIEKDLGDLNHYLYQAHQIMRAFIEGKVTDARDMNAQLKGHLIEAEELLKKMKILDHQAIKEQEDREKQRKRRDMEEKEFLAKIEQKYHIRFGSWDQRANVIGIKDAEGHTITHLEMPHMMGFSNPDFKKILEEKLVVILHKNELLVPGQHSRGFELKYLGDSKKRLHEMKVMINGDTMHTPYGNFNLNEGTPTKEITLSPNPHSFDGVILECINVQNKRSRFKLERGRLREA